MDDDKRNWLAGHWSWWVCLLLAGGCCRDCTDFIHDAELRSLRRAVELYSSGDK